MRLDTTGEERSSVGNCAKKLKFGNIKKWYIHKPESVLENETHKILRDFETQTDHLNADRRLDIMIINKEKENLSYSVLCRFCGSQSENKRKENIDKYFDLARELKKTIEHKSSGNTKIPERLQGLRRWVRRVGNQRKNQYHNSIFIIFTNPSARAGYDTRSIFKRSLTGFNSEFSFS